VYGLTDACPRLETGLCAACAPSGALLELADMAMFDFIISNIDRGVVSSGEWKEESGLFDAPACTRPLPAVGTEQGGVAVSNMHCMGTAGALALVDQGQAFDFSSRTPGFTAPMPFLLRHGGGRPPQGAGLCVSAATRAAVLAAAGDAEAFGRRYRAVEKEVEGEVVDALFALHTPPQRAEARAALHFPPAVRRAVVSNFGAVREFVEREGCTPDLPAWRKALAGLLLEQEA
jgi:hypothetical protein